MNHRSLRASPGGLDRGVVPLQHPLGVGEAAAFSVCAAAGKKKTSVLMSSVRISPVSISGPFFQNVALSIMTRSRTTSQSRLAIPSRCIRPFAEPTAGFWPNRK